jgi:lipopolysaccharide biosynthesis protein
VNVLELTTGFTRDQSNGDSFWVDENKVRLSLEKFPCGGDILVVIHAYYPDILVEMRPYLEILRGRAVMLITTPEQGVEACQEWAASSNWNATVLASVNRGRDWAPFIGLTNLLPNLEFRSILKLHTKRSSHRDDGNQWLHHLLSGLLYSEESVERVLQEMKTANPGSHIFAASGSLAPIGDWLETSASSHAKDFAKNLWPDFVSSLEYPAGSMFWMHQDVWNAFGQLGLAPTDFEPELGQLDGTLSHALERHVAVKTMSFKSSIEGMHCS